MAKGGWIDGRHKLHCPLCNSTFINGDLDEIERRGGAQLGYFAIRYKCKKCNQTFRYEPSRKYWSGEAMSTMNPYGDFTQGLKSVPVIGKSN